MVSVAPRLEDKVTVAPGTGLLFTSRTVTVIVLTVTPSATTLVGAAATVEVPPLTGPAVNVIVGGELIVTPFATAVITAPPEVKELTVAINCPLPFVVPEAGVIVSVAPREELRVTTAPLTKLLFTSRTVTVMVLVAVPFATTLVGAATTVEFAALTAPAVNVTLAVDVIATLFATALIVDVPIVVDLTVPVICPLAFVVPEGWVMVSVAPRLEDKVTVAPGTGLLFTSRTVTVIVLTVTPSATTLVGAAATVEVPPLTGPAVNVIVGGELIVTPPATAVITAVPDVNDVTVAINCPDPFVVPEAGVSVSVVPREELKLTVAPDTKLLFTSRTVTVIVLVAVPSATTLVGLAATVEEPPVTAPAVNVTIAVAACATLFATALIVDVPIVVDLTVPVICPLAFVVPEGWGMVSVAPRLEDKVTVAPGTGLLFTSRTVTVIVLTVTPSATTLVGAAATVDVPPLTGPAVNVIVGGELIVTPFATAVITAPPEVKELTVAINCPLPFVVPEAGVIVSVEPRFELKLTLAPTTKLLF